MIKKETSEMNAAAIILSGGKSSRMGVNKALLRINEQTNIERIRDKLKVYFHEIILVTNHPEDYSFVQLNTTCDYFTDRGPMAGLHAGLMYSDYDVNLVVACDMPFLSGELAVEMVKRCLHYDAVIPVINGKQHPLFSVFKKTVAQEAENCIKTGNLRMKDLIRRLNVLFVTEKELESFGLIDWDRIFFNMNRPEEYEKAKKWAEIE
ncbi:molybdenum cofactor guanylyltransferase [Neobacillus thermocopriae]|nr:molybdenum cofactor guanylyltransferase [Neobacillus thermocopriae]